MRDPAGVRTSRNLTEAVSDFRTALEHGSATEVLGGLGNAHARAGRLLEAQATLAELLRIEQADQSASVALARVYAGPGDKKQAIEWLRKAAEGHVTGVTFIGVDPAFDPLRSEPDFEALCARPGLPAGVGRLP